MKVATITLLVCLGLASTALAEGKASLSDVRKLTHELVRDSSKLSDLMTQYGEMLNKRPSGKGEQLEKWNRALDRLVSRIKKAHGSVVESKQHLDQAAKAGKLPTALGKEVANAQNDADAKRAAAEQVLSKRKPRAKSAKRAKKEPPPDNGDSHLLDDL